MRPWLWIFVLLSATAARAEIIDQIAVTVDKIVITASDVASHLRVAALLNGDPLDLSPEARKEAVNRLVEQALVRREMEISRYPAPSMEEVDPMLAEYRSGRYQTEQEFQEALDRYGVTERELRENLLLQLTVLRFIEYRFRPGIAIAEAELERYYREEFLPRWQRQNSQAPPPLDDVTEDIEDVLISRQVDEALDDWLRQAAEQADIEFRPEAFQ